MAGQGDRLDGATVIARSLKTQGVETLFGVVGFPVFGIARAAQREGIRYLGFRNEQAASYAAGAVGYLTGRPGACLAVSGPGMIHAVAGLANAQANCWPMIRLGGANDSYQNGQGAFQEAPQIEAARPFVKYAARPDRLERVPYYLEQATRTSLYGRPGAVYLDLPNDIISGEAAAQQVDWKPRCADPPRSLADPAAVERALELLRGAERPLVIVGKGAAYARAEGSVRRFLEATGLPYLPTPMGKGVLPDSHPLSVAPARSLALREADVIFLIGARLNWILHFGLPPRFAEDVSVIQLDIAAEEIGANVPARAALVGDAGAVLDQLGEALARRPFRFPADSPWWSGLTARIDENRRAVEAMERDERSPMGYYRVLRALRERLPLDAVIVSEGASTMDIGRSALPNALPRHRLDAGSFGTMGVGLAFAIAAATVYADRRIVAVEGDSAFGFSGMEVEVACRYRLPITFVVLNNNGIGGGVDTLDRSRPLPPSVYTPGAHYERVIEAFGGRGFFADRPSELEKTLDAALAEEGPSLVNIPIDPHAARKPQEFAWLTR
ncbi:MAG: oxalyl-CoA decarboxylase [Myxococcota bacterium]